MAPHEYAVARWQQKEMEDYQLAVDIGGAKFDLNPLIEDGDRADAQIEANIRRNEKLVTQLHQVQSGDPSDPHVRMQERANDVSKMVRLVTKSDVKEKSKEPPKQLEAVSRDFSRPQKQSHDLRQMCLDLHQVIEGSSRTEHPRNSIEQLQRQAGSEGLLYKASEYEGLRSWVAGLGGRGVVEEAVSQAASVSPLLQQNGGIDGLQSQVLRAASVKPMMELLTGTESQAMAQLLRDHGGLAGIQKKVTQAVSVTPLLEGIKSEALEGFVNKMVETFADYGGIEGVRRELNTLPELDHVVKALFDHFVKVESGSSPNFHNLSKSLLNQIQDTGTLGNVAPKVRAILAEERTLAEKFEEQCVVGNKAAADLDQSRKQCALLLEQIECYKLQIKDKDEAIALYRSNIGG